MNRKLVASELIKVAQSLLAIDFPTDKAMKQYLKEHPDADKSNHRVVKTEKKKTTGKRPHELSREEREPVINKLMKLPLGKLRKNQSLIRQQLQTAWEKNPESNLDELDAMHQMTTEAILRKTNPKRTPKDTLFPMKFK